MARIPSNGMRKAYQKLMDTNVPNVVFNTHHKLTFVFDEENDTTTTAYYHYDVLVGSVTWVRSNYKFVVKLTNNGFSDTDRDNFNGLLRCKGIRSITCHKEGEELYLTKGNDKTRYKEVSE